MRTAGRRSLLTLSVVALLAVALPLGTTAPAARADDPCGLGLGLEQMGALPVQTERCDGVRPGGRVRTPLGSCTLNFLFAGDDGNRYIGTAGHCIRGMGPGSRVYTPPGPVASVAGSRIGTFAWAEFDGVRDFALIRLDEGVPASPEMIHFGGPTALYEDHSLAPVVLHHYGHGVEVSTVAPGRTGVAPQTVNLERVYFDGIALWGDSGSGVIDAEGRAVGVLVNLFGRNGTDLPPSATVLRATRIDHQLPRAEADLGIDLTLVTAPLRTLGASS